MSLSWNANKRTDVELLEFLQRQRMWETEMRKYCREDRLNLWRGVRNALLVAVPLWMALGRLCGWW
jgi:hypothetical protein